MCAYSTSKAAVIGLAKSTGKEYAETGITVNSLAPAVVRTAMVAAMDPEQVKYMTDKIPKKRSASQHQNHGVQPKSLPLKGTFSLVATACLRTL